MKIMSKKNISNRPLRNKGAQDHGLKKSGRATASGNGAPEHARQDTPQDLGMNPPRRHHAQDSRHAAKRSRTGTPAKTENAKRDALSSALPDRAGSKKMPRPERPPHPQKEARTDAKETNAANGARNPRQLVVETLMRIKDGGFSNIVWDIAIRHAALSNLDKMLATRIFYGTLSNMRLIDTLWADIEPEMTKRADAVVKMTLRCAMYQLVFLDRVPAYSIVSTSVDVVKRLRNRAASGYCNALLRKAVARQEQGLLKFVPTGNALEDFAIQYSLNDDLARLLMEEFGDEAQKIAQSMLSVPRMMLRLNRSRTNMKAFLAQEGIDVEVSDKLPESACAVVTRHPAVDEAIERGDVCVQDEAAQLAVAALGMPAAWGNGREEVHIWDACAGLGGKSIHIMDAVAAACDGRKYALLSTDLYANKLERLRDSQQKYFPSQPLLTKTRDLTVAGSVPMAPFDVILVDAPCSGLGVLRRHPEVKMTRTADAIRALVGLQKQILDNVCRHLRVGGCLVYAVCTITTEECERQVEDFLKNHPNFTPDPLPENVAPDGRSSVKWMPHTDGCDGFFVARFVRQS